MEEFSSNQQVRPGDATQLMNVIFSSDEEMMAFYLTLNRLVNPESNLIERSDQRKLEDLYYLLHNNITAFEAIGSYITDLLIRSPSTAFTLPINHLFKTSYG